MEQSREHMLNIVKENKSISFEKIFTTCENRIHAIFIFLSLLELVQQRFMTILSGEGRNNFLLEWNENRDLEIIDQENISPSLN